MSTFLGGINEVRIEVHEGSGIRVALSQLSQRRTAKGPRDRADGYRVEGWRAEQ